MKKMKMSVMALLSAAVLTFSSCLGDGDSTQYYGGIGTSSISNITLDNGVKVVAQGLTPEMGTRVFIWGPVLDEDFDMNSIQQGSTVHVSPQLPLALDKDDLEGEEFDFEQVENLTEIDDFMWFSVLGGSWGIGNGWVNFSIACDHYVKKTTSSNGQQGSVSVQPRYYLKVAKIDKNAKTVELHFGIDNRKSECVEEKDGKEVLKKDYSLISGDYSNQLLACSIDVSNLYYTLTSSEYGFSDTDKVDFKYTLVYKDEDGKLHKESEDLPYDNALEVGLLKRMHY